MCTYRLYLKKALEPGCKPRRTRVLFTTSSILKRRFHLAGDPNKAAAGGRNHQQFLTPISCGTLHLFGACLAVRGDLHWLHRSQLQVAGRNSGAQTASRYIGPLFARMFVVMKRIAIIAAVFVFILFLTKIANQVPPPSPPGTVFSLKAQKVIQCSPDEITLVDNHMKATHLEKDASWPDCEAFHKDDTVDFYLSRGEKTHFLSYEKTIWWRKAM
jgi:hypothetical protein